MNWNWTNSYWIYSRTSGSKMNCWNFSNYCYENWNSKIGWTKMNCNWMTIDSNWTRTDSTRIENYCYPTIPDRVVSRPRSYCWKTN
jgi:hypothetical protein